MSKVVSIILAVISLILFYTFGIYNRIQTVDEDVTTAWSEVINQYQRRADLIPNIVNSVKDYSVDKKQALTDVVNARDKAISVQTSSDMLNDSTVFQKFIQAQDQLSSFLARLLQTVEQSSSLTANSEFKSLQTQLEGIEKQITITRNRYIKIVGDYNLMLQKFPGNILAGIMGYNTKPNLKGTNKVSIAN